jgi:hypothetical protein
MRRCACFSLTIGFTLLAAGPVLAGPPADPFRSTKVRQGGYTNSPRYTPGIVGYGYRGMRTRIDAIREIDDLTSRATERFENRFPNSPVRRLMERRNLLGARSPMGRKMTADLGLRTMQDPDSSKPVISLDFYESVPTSMPAADPMLLDQPVKGPNYETILETRIKQMSEEYYQKGIEYTFKYDNRNKKINTLLQARSYFDLSADACPDNPRPYLANAIVSFHNSEAHQAFHYLVEGLKRTKTADDLKIDKSSFFKDENDFRAMYDRATSFARTLDENNETAGNLMLAYFAYLYGDTVLATTSIEAAAKEPPPAYEDMILRFRDIIAKAPLVQSPPEVGN